MAKKLPKAQRSIDPGFSQPGRSTRRPNNDPGFARGSKKDFEKGIVKGILALNPPKKPSIDQLLQQAIDKQKKNPSLKELKKGGVIKKKK